MYKLNHYYLKSEKQDADSIFAAGHVCGLVAWLFLVWSAPFPTSSLGFVAFHSPPILEQTSPLGAMAIPISIVSVITASAKLAHGIYVYASSIKNAPSYAQELAAEVAATETVLGSLRTHLELENLKGSAFDRTSILFFAINGCNQRLQEIDQKLSSLTSGSKTSRFKNRVKWPMDH